MEIGKFKICSIIFINFALIIFISCIAYSGTLGDIRKKTGWQSRDHSERNSWLIPLITPAELIAHLDKYHKDTIRMQVLFNKISSQGLNIWIGTKGNRHRWSSKRYISFSVDDPDRKVQGKDIYLFISKNNPDAEKLFGLSKGARIIVKGRVRDIAKGKAWVEVLGIDLY